MKVILTENIEKVGNKGDVINVKRGYARNYLVPRNYAIYATPMNLKKLDGLKKQFADEESKRIEKFRILGEQISKLKLSFIRKVDEHESMYGSVSEMDILHELKEKNIDIPKAAIILDKHIKQLGEFDVPVHLHKEVSVMLSVSVAKEAVEKAAKTKVEPVAEAVVAAEPVAEEIIEEAVAEEAAEEEVVEETVEEVVEEVTEDNKSE
jgi:large subunit ribosomal protein L9